MSFQGSDDNFMQGLMDSHLVTVASSELTNPLILIRQLGLALSEENISDNERKLISERLTLTSERALRIAFRLNLTSADQTELRLEPINPVSLCQDVIKELDPLYYAHGKSIKLKTRTRVPLLVGDRRILHQIILGLGDNALNYCSENQPIRVTIKLKDPYVRISVRDYGPALPTDLWRKIEDGVKKRAISPVAGRPSISITALITLQMLARLMGSRLGLIRHRDGSTFYIDLHASKQIRLI